MGDVSWPVPGDSLQENFTGLCMDLSDRSSCGMRVYTVRKRCF